MGKLENSGLSVLLLAASQFGHAAVLPRAGSLPSHLDGPRATCDTSVRVIHLAARLRNLSNRDIEFHLDDDRGPRLDPWYLGYRVHSAAPGEPFRLVHNSGHDSEWSRTVAIAPGNSAEFNVPIFGLRPADYHHYFRIELRDAKRRSYWTPAFELCAVVRSNCECPQTGGLAVGSKGRRQACATGKPATVATAATPIEVGVSCR